MAGALSSLIEDAFREACSWTSLRVVLKESFGSSNPDARAGIRANIELSLAPLLKATDLGPLRDLEQVPLKAGEGFLSISHADTLGGWVHAPRPVGFDVERAHRVSEKIIARIASTKEVAEAPSPAELWAAKESVFKVLAHARQPSVVSQFEIVDWKAGFFRVKETSKFSAPEITGCVISHQGFVFSLSSFLP